MKTFIKPIHFTALALALVGCGSDDGHHDGPVAPVVTVDDRSTGAYTVSVGDANAPTVGTYYAGADGSRLLVLNNSADKVTHLYRRSDSAGKWVAVPQPGTDVTVKLLRSDAQVSATLAVADMAGSYVTQVTTAVVARFSVAADGTLSAGSTPCKLSGKIGAGRMPNTLALTLNATDCGNSLLASNTGVIAVDRDFAPVAFRVLGDNDTAIADLWAYRE